MQPKLLHRNKTREGGRYRNLKYRLLVIKQNIQKKSVNNKDDIMMRKEKICKNTAKKTQAKMERECKQEQIKWHNRVNPKIFACGKKTSVTFNTYFDFPQ